MSGEIHRIPKKDVKARRVIKTWKTEDDGRRLTTVHRAMAWGSITCYFRMPILTASRKRPQ